MPRMQTCEKIGEVDLDAIKDQSFIPEKETEQTFWVKDRNGWNIFVPDHKSEKSDFVQFQQNKNEFQDYQTRRTTIDTSGDHNKVVKTEIFKDGEKIKEESYK